MNAEERMSLCSYFGIIDELYFLPSHETVKQCFGDNLSFYFRILLTDQRGWNMRNNVCHGISPANA
jgi:hypothetical protein